MYVSMQLRMVIYQYCDGPVRMDVIGMGGYVYTQLRMVI
jgi:hypothetical protein